MNTPDIPLPRLRLRDFTGHDLPFVYAGLSHPDVIKHYGISYDSIDACQLQMDWFQSIRRDGTGRWLAIERKDDGQPIGAIGLSSLSREHRCAELGYWLLPQFWGEGYMREALAGFVEYAFRELGLHRIEAEVELDNTASQKQLAAAGFTLEGIRRECEMKNGAFLSLAGYARLSTDPDPRAGRANAAHT
ncbi:GNAT family N-acetyltransferase [Paludibacterium paludis]|uniref:N-acetyltransferase n=1 Tax=Paludibacterium paludis TaxID=1225769 RepID=A0A918P282_9NEIS|nr:GNAT family N-acetyltransferase [Paludibacterium paludis]GGY13937.1 N-acetyltransferase [Paludibacterium paludis]